jgi:hypothetical protein
LFSSELQPGGGDIRDDQVESHPLKQRAQLNAAQQTAVVTRNVYLRPDASTPTHPLDSGKSRHIAGAISGYCLYSGTNISEVIVSKTPAMAIA